MNIYDINCTSKWYLLLQGERIYPREFFYDPKIKSITLWENIWDKQELNLRRAQKPTKLDMCRGNLKEGVPSVIPNNTDKSPTDKKMVKSDLEIYISM